MATAASSMNDVLLIVCPVRFPVGRCGWEEGDTLENAVPSEGGVRL